MKLLLNTEDLLKAVLNLQGVYPIMVATSIPCEDVLPDVTIRLYQKFKLTDDIESIEDGKSKVAVICNEDWVPEFDDFTEEAFIRDFELNYNK